MPITIKEDCGDIMYGSMRLPVKDTQGQFCFGFVGYADIIGFGDKIINSLHRKMVVDAYNEILKRIRTKDDWVYAHKAGTLKGYGQPAGQDYHHVIPVADHLYMVSDSIFFILIPESSVKYAMGASHVDFLQFGLTAVRLMAEIMTICWEFGLPARGAISDGNVYYDSDKQIFVGEPLVKAVRWENTQSFAWFTIDPTSTISQETKSRPRSLLSKATTTLNDRDIFFKKEEIASFKKKWPFEPLAPLTACPDLEGSVLLDQAVGVGMPNIVVSNINNQIEQNSNTKNPKHAEFWRNTKEVLHMLGTI